MFKLLKRHRFRVSQFLITTESSFFHTCRHKNLYFGIGQHGRTDIAAIHYNAFAKRHLTLQMTQSGPYTFDLRILRHKAANLKTPNMRRYVFPINQHLLDVFFRNKLNNHIVNFLVHLILIFRFYAFSDHIPGDCPVHCACIDINIRQLLGYQSGYSTLACPGRSVDGDVNSVVSMCTLPIQRGIPPQTLFHKKSI
ncbi:hypothetical protein D3C71_1377200 [compost metagenome]